MAPRERRTETVSLIWEAVTIKVRYVPEWHGRSSGYEIAHLEVLSIAPDRAPLPITETGYRSHFLSPAEVEEFGGPEGYVRAWLEAEAKSPEWLEHVATSRQMTLF